MAATRGKTICFILFPHGEETVKTVKEVARPGYTAIHRGVNENDNFLCR